MPIANQMTERGIKMRDLKAVYEKCKGVLDDIGIRYDYDTPISVNNRLTRAMGKTKAIPNGYDWNRRAVYRHEITINPAMLSDDVPEDELENTVLHELLHTVPGCMNHGSKWQHLARKVNNMYGYHITTTGYVPAVAERWEAKNQTKYICACEKCGAEWGYKRWCKVTANPGKYRHTGCGGDLYLKWHGPSVQVLSVKPRHSVAS